MSETHANMSLPRGFDPVWYLQTHTDVRLSGQDPGDHYRTVGRSEGRRYLRSRAAELDHALWRGHAAMAEPALTDLLTGDVPSERAMAGWALARWRLDRDDVAGALEAITAFHAVADADRPVGHPGPWLLAVQVGARAGDDAGLTLAKTVLAEAVTRFGDIPDITLARIVLARATGGDWQGLLPELHAGRGDLVSLAVSPGQGAPLDRLAAITVPPVPDVPGGGPHPVVTVILPVHNGSAHLACALDGLMRQSWPALEILVVDDGSTDDSAVIARDHAARDPRIRVLEMGRNQGAYPTRNAGFAAATGDFVTVHDADDWSHPQKIAAQVTPLIAHPDLVATVSHWVRVGPELEMTRWRMEEAWVHRNVSSLMIRAGLRDTLGYWDRARVNADTEYYYRVITAHGAASIQEVYAGVPLAFGRTDPASLTVTSATHLRSQFGGLRRDYMFAARRWHDGAEVADLYLPQVPDLRPFRIPDAAGVGDPQPAPDDHDLLAGSDLFDAVWYQQANPDVMVAEVDPVDHYLAGGASENRDPGPGFSTGGYRIAAGLDDDVNPLVHYLTEGQGAAPCPTFEGALADEAGPRIMMFAHTSGKTLFGAERSLLHVLEGMVGRGQRPVVVVPALRNPEYLDRLLALSVAVETLPQAWRNGYRAPDPRSVAAARDLIARHAPQEVHVNTLVLDAPLLAAREAGVPTVVHVRELPAEDSALTTSLDMGPEALRETLLSQADRFVVTAQAARRWLGAGDRVTVRPNAVAPALFSLPAPAAIRGGVLRAGLVSSNVAKKGVADLLAVARLTEHLDDRLRFVFVGPPTADLHLLRPWPGNVDFAGYAATPVEAMANLDVVLSLSRFAESFGRTVMEGMAAGRPVVCYDRGAPPDLVEHGVSGLVVPADDPAAAARAVLALSAARRGLARMGAAARLRAMDLQAQAVAE
ncbi:glycosyltransferase [Jannaschia sp. 2305UL9-9]|uniref:glycosyltransferase n=1 Tax=Jannaschia sp. 2305UL9-9 TaxID=3121638 RepID=UPI0035282AB4